MAQLETLEAKMASIEVSLSTTPRRKKNGSVGSGGPLHRPTKDLAKELESLRNALRDKENIIQSLKGQLSTSLSLSRLSGSYLRQQHPSQPLNEQERRAAEERLERLRQDMDNKRLAIKNLKMALERLDITDNIDVRIQQAELEYQLGREELNLLTLLEESRNLQMCLEDAEQNRSRNDAATIYSCLNGSNYASLHAVELNYDPKSPRFGAAPRDGAPGLYVDWAAEGAGVMKGDRLVEVNGRLVLTKGRDDLARLLAASPEPALLVVLRTRHDMPDHTNALRDELGAARERADGLRSANMRLTHRISYLEEQVAELLSRLTPPPTQTSSTASVEQNSSTGKTELQVFQKGPQVTALIANLPGLDVGNKSPAECRQNLPTLRPKPANSTSVNNSPMKNHDTRSTRSLDFGSDCSSGGIQHLQSPFKHEKRYSQLTSTGRNINSLDICSMEPSPQYKYSSQQQISDSCRIKNSHSVSDYGSDHSTSTDHKKSQQRKPAEIHHHRRSEGRYQLTEAKSLKSILDYASESSSGIQRFHKSHDARSVKSLDFDSEPTSGHQHRHEGRHHAVRPHDVRSTKSLDYSSESSSHIISHPKKHHLGETKMQRPTPPKKPLRLSLHRAASLQSVNMPLPPTSPGTNDSLPQNCNRKPTKRNHKGEAPATPVVVHISNRSQQAHWSSSPLQENVMKTGTSSNEKWY
ncbi:uncharacterized protein sprt [Anabrus simplex]|uniref:uncharacterized protein sprt n=1 Tax=Anabrus simplex TaxID=316456 RepID=UPI0035A3C74C